MSGAMTGYKGDVDSGKFKVGQFKIECKRTDKQSFRITAEMVRKICKEARYSGKIPAIQIDLGGIREVIADSQWIAIPLDVFTELVGG